MEIISSIENEKMTSEYSLKQIKNSYAIAVSISYGFRHEGIHIYR